jgi:hypothetical protein
MYVVVKIASFKICRIRGLISQKDPFSVYLEYFCILSSPSFKLWCIKIHKKCVWSLPKEVKYICKIGTILCLSPNLSGSSHSDRDSKCRSCRPSTHIFLLWFIKKKYCSIDALKTHLPSIGDILMKIRLFMAST